MYQQLKQGTTKHTIFIACLILLILFLFIKESKAQQTYSYIFNLIKGFVQESEKPYRDELCLNGKWQFMPAFINDINLTNLKIYVAGVQQEESH